MHWLNFPGGSGAWTEGGLSPLGRTWTSLAHDEFDLDDSVEGNNVLRKADIVIVRFLSQNLPLFLLQGQPLLTLKEAKVPSDNLGQCDISLMF